MFLLPILLFSGIAFVSSLERFPPNDDLSFGGEVEEQVRPEWVANPNTDFQTNEPTTQEISDVLFREDFGPAGSLPDADWKYDAKEWTLYQATNSAHDDIPAENSPKLILVATPKDPQEKIRLNIDINDSSKFKIHYKYFVSRGAGKDNPLLQVFLSSNTTRTATLLTQEKEGIDWNERTLKFEAGKGDRIVFVAQIKSRQNEVALGDVMVLKSSSLLFPEPMSVGKKETSNDKENASLLKQKKQNKQSSYTHLGPEEASDDQTGLVEEVPEIATITDVPIMKDDGSSAAAAFTTPSSDKMMKNTFTSRSQSTSSTRKETSSSIDNDDISEEFAQDGASNKSDSDNIDAPMDVTESQMEESLAENTAEGTSNGDAIVTLKSTENKTSGTALRVCLVLLTMGGLAALIFILWRRRKRRRRDDEIPVFSRPATEHQNPSFASDAEGDAGDGSQNYRSFQ